MQIMVDNEGYEQFIEIMESLKQENIDNGLKGNEAYINDPGNTWHDNFDFEVVMRKSRTIAAKIDKMYEEKKNLIVVKKEDLPNNVVNIGDVLKIEITYAQSTPEIEIVKLTGKYIPNINSDIEEITLNSPIGKTIFKEQIGKVIEFKINGQPAKIKVIEKIM